MADTADWLSALEDKVHAAADRIGALSEENAALRGRIAELEQRLATASSAPEDTGASQWEEERREIRERVERLTRTLEELAGV